jgi:hypothetical protein
MNAAEKTQSLSSLQQADPFIAEPVSLNADQNDQVKPNEISVLTRRMHGHDGAVISRAKGKKPQPAFSKNKRAFFEATKQAEKEFK